MKWLLSAGMALAIVALAPAGAQADEGTSVVDAEEVAGPADPGRELFETALAKFRRDLVAVREVCRAERDEVGGVVARRGEAERGACLREIRLVRSAFLAAAREARQVSHTFRQEQRRLAKERREADELRREVEETALEERAKAEERARSGLRKRLEAEQVRAEKARAEKARAAEKAKQKKEPQRCDAQDELAWKRAKLERRATELQAAVAYKLSEQQKHEALADEYLAKADASDGETRAKYLEKAAWAEKQSLEWAAHAERYAAELASVQQQLAELPVHANHDDAGDCR